MNRYTMFPVNVCNNELNRTYHRTFLFTMLGFTESYVSSQVRAQGQGQLGFTNIIIYFLPSSGRGFDHNELNEEIGFDFSSRSRQQSCGNERTLVVSPNRTSFHYRCTFISIDLKETFMAQYFISLSIQVSCLESYTFKISKCCLEIFPTELFTTFFYSF